MKKYLLCLLLGLLSFGARAQVLLGQETFENAAGDVGYTSTTPFSVPTADPSVLMEYFQLINHTAGTPYTPWSTANATLGNQQGANFWGAEGVRGTSNIIVRPAAYVQLNDITTANYTNLKVTVAFSSPRGNPYSGFGRLGVRRQDQVLVQYSFDGTT